MDHVADTAAGAQAATAAAFTSAVGGTGPLYHRVAADIERAIASGSLRSGDRLPSVRKLCSQHHVSVSTATLAYRWLENRSLVEARPKSGYFVAPRRAPLPEPELDTRMGQAGLVTGNAIRRRFLLSNDDGTALPSFCTMPAASLLPEARLRQLTASLNRQHPEYASSYHVAGSAALRQEIARRSVDAGVRLRADQVLLTQGGTEAIYLALRAVTQPGDTVAIESPTYFMWLEAVKSLGLKSIEIPTHPRDGMSIDALDFATRTPGAVQACLVIPNFQNPLGSLMSVADKRRLVALASARRFTLVESDVYGDMHFGDERPPVLKSFDEHDDVILCSSFSKTVAPGFRVGWMAPGRHFEAAQSMKFCTSLTGARLPQEVLAQFMKTGGYDHHLRRLRAALKTQAAEMVDMVARHFPAGCKVSRPQGGLILWIELPPHVDSRLVFERALAEQIGIAPGTIFSCSRRYDQFIRLNYGEPWSSKLERKVARAGQIVADAVAAASG